MSRKATQDWPALLQEYDERTAADEKVTAIKADFIARLSTEEKKFSWGTFANKLTERRKSQSTTAEKDTTTKVKDSDTDVEIYTDAVGEFDTLPDGYAKDIQPMREYTEAEDAALKESVRLFGFVGAIVRDQYGRILDGNQRSRVAYFFGTGCPYTKTYVKDDDNALAIATSLNAVRRQYPREQREQIALAMRDQGFSYRVIAEALRVSVNTVQRDVSGVRQSTPEPTITESPVLHSTPEVVMTSEVSTDLTPDPVSTESPVLESTPDPVKRVKGRDEKSYPAQRPSQKPGQKPTAEITGLKWVRIFQSMFAKYTETVETFQLEGGITVLAREMPTEAQQLFLDLLREQAQRWSGMVAHFERTIATPIWTNEPTITEETIVNAPADAPGETTTPHISEATLPAMAEAEAADEGQGTDELGTCYECGRGLTVEDAVICRHCGEMFHGPCQQSHMDQEDDAPADADA